ncbi:unnamed protein product [Dicrocoelium dendriticum]|nr:unnamed protein product [Dicrocoelium dendriticum]
MPHGFSFQAFRGGGGPYIVWGRDWGGGGGGVGWGGSGVMDVDIGLWVWEGCCGGGGGGGGGVGVGGGEGRVVGGNTLREEHMISVEK